jgi:hypothetical protein
VTDWVEGQRNIAAVAQQQLFFVGGAPRSGTTWLQLLLDAHPQVSCGGEGLFKVALADPLDRLLADRRAALADKNTLFTETGGYKLPEQDDADLLLGTAILLALERQRAGKPTLAIGEKTPENIFFFPRLKRLFPGAKLIALARDPRDVLTSAWHMFTKTKSADPAAKIEYIRKAMPSLDQGARMMLALAEEDPGSCLIVTYEAMLASTAPVAARLFRFLGVSDAEDVVADCVARTSFAALSRGSPPGAAEDGGFFRKGIVGDWRSTFSSEMSALIIKELGWMYPHFGWTP